MDEEGLKLLERERATPRARDNLLDADAACLLGQRDRLCGVHGGEVARPGRWRGRDTLGNKRRGGLIDDFEPFTPRLVARKEQPLRSSPFMLKDFLRYAMSASMREPSRPLWIYALPLHFLAPVQELPLPLQVSILPSLRLSLARLRFDRALEQRPLDASSRERLVDDNGSSLSLDGVETELSLARASELDDMGGRTEGDGDVVDDGADVGTRRDGHGDFERRWSSFCRYHGV